MTKLRTLHKLQDQEARIVTKSSSDTSSMDLIQSLNWLFVSDIIRSETATTVYRWLKKYVDLVDPSDKNIA